MNLAAYREMLKQDFNFGGVISECYFVGASAGGGERVFVDAILARYPQGNPNVGNTPENLAALAREIWSYATTGADTSGKTDIAEMQGLLFALDARIQESSATNTPMSRGTFVLPGTGVNLPLGDGRHGRATVLTTRHLLANIKVTTHSPGRLATTEKKTFEEGDRFILDNSDSFKSKYDPFIAWVSGVLGVDKTAIEQRKDANFGVYNVRVEHAVAEIEAAAGRTESATGKDQAARNNAPGGKRKAKAPKKAGEPKTVSDWGKVLEEAYGYLHPGKTEEDANSYAKLFGLDFAKLHEPNYVKVLGRNFARFFGLKRTHAFVREEKGDNAQYTLNGKEFMLALGEPRWGRPYGASGESEIKAVIATLLYGQDYTDEALARTEQRKRPRINIIIDEVEQGLEYLPLAQELAKAKGVEVRLLPVPLPLGSAEWIIDLQSIKVTMKNAPIGLADRKKKAPGAGYFIVGTITFDAVVNGVMIRNNKANILKPAREAGFGDARGYFLESMTLHGTHE